MNEKEARERIEQYLKSPGVAPGHRPEEGWLSKSPILRQLSDGEWLATHPTQPHQGLLIMDDRCIPFSGALGKLVPKIGLGFPTSREYFLGSACRGRYQNYQYGLAVWEKFEYGEDIGYPVAQWDSMDQRARTCQALVAFFDLRGFTKWSSSQSPYDVQQVIELLERSFQDAFAREWCKKLFVKGTGDGFMVVSEDKWFESRTDVTNGTFRAGHVKAFCGACAETIKNSIQGEIPLEIGCGITSGEIKQLYLLGRVDYVGPSVNQASKMQANAKNQLCISEEIVRFLNSDGVTVDGQPANGVLVGYESLIFD